MNKSNVSLSNNSLVNTYCKYDEPDTDLERISKHTVIVLLIVVGIFLNIFIIILAAKYTVRKNLHHLIINMAVSDALFLFMRFWRYLPWLSDFKWRIYPKGVLGVIFCKTETVLFHSSYMVSLITLLIISIERFKATRQRLKRSTQYTLKQRLLIIGFSWFISSPFAVYFAFHAEVFSDGKFCVLFLSAHDVQSFIIFITHLIFIAILCCVIFFLSVLIIRRLTRPQAIQNHLSQVQLTERARRTQAAVRMVLASVLLYICCWMPCSVYLVLLGVYYLIPSVNIFSACFDRRSLNFTLDILLPVINSTFSSFMYIIFLNDFRQAAKKVFCRRNTLNEVPNRRNSFEMQPMARRRRNCGEEDIEL